MIISNCIHVATNGIFFFLTERYLPVHLYHIFLILSSVDGNLGHFRVLAIVNDAAVNTGVRVSFWIRFVWVYAQKWNCWLTW